MVCKYTVHRTPYTLNRIPNTEINRCSQEQGQGPLTPDRSELLLHMFR